MRVMAPGKVLLSGAYAVLEGAPSIVCAIDRHAFATRDPSPDARDQIVPAEVRAALALAPYVDARSLTRDGTKLGLGSSAAALVAALAFDAVSRGEELSPPTLERIFAIAREAHARVQHGGSGVDVAASTFGGVLRYRFANTPIHERVELPPGVELTVFFSGTSARTSALRERVEALRVRDVAEHRARMTLLSEIADDASAAIDAADPRAFIAAIAASGVALAALGASADAPIVPPSFGELARCAERESAAFIPSGAGGGDVGVLVSAASPSASFMQQAARAGMIHLDLRVDPRGVRIEGNEGTS